MYLNIYYYIVDCIYVDDQFCTKGDLYAAIGCVYVNMTCYMFASLAHSFSYGNIHDKSILLQFTVERNPSSFEMASLPVL